MDFSLWLQTTTSVSICLQQTEIKEPIESPRNKLN